MSPYDDYNEFVKNQLVNESVKSYYNHSFNIWSNDNSIKLANYVNSLPDVLEQNHDPKKLEAAKNILLSLNLPEDNFWKKYLMITINNKLTPF